MTNYKSILKMIEKKIRFYSEFSKEINYILYENQVYNQIKKFFV